MSGITGIGRGTIRQMHLKMLSDSVSGILAGGDTRTIFYEAFSFMVGMGVSGTFTQHVIRPVDWSVGTTSYYALHNTAGTTENYGAFWDYITV